MLGQPAQTFDSVAAQAAQARDSENLDEAVRLYGQAVRLRPEWAEGWWYLGAIAYDRGHFRQAVDALDKVTTLAPRDPKAFAMLGLSEAKLNRNQPALTHLAQAVTLGVGDEANMRQVVLLYTSQTAFGYRCVRPYQESLDQLAKERTHEDDRVTYRAWQVRVRSSVRSTRPPRPRLGI